MTIAARAGAIVLGALGLAAAPPALTPNILAWTPAQQAYGYKHIDQVAPVAVVRRGSMVHPLPLAPRQIAPAVVLEGKPVSLDEFMRRQRTSGLIAIKDGRVILERYGLGRTPKERWVSFSVAKSVTSTLIGAAIRDGKIGGLDDPVTRYIPQLNESAYDGVTIRQLITMTSGAAWNEDYADPNSDVAKVGFVKGEAGMSPIVSYMRHLKRAAAPGTRFHYDTGETDLAGILVSNAVGKPLAQYLSEKIWAPFGMEADATWLQDVAGHERGGCCLNMTLRDYARLGLFMLDGGVAGGKAVLPDGWVADATSGHVKAPDDPLGYGYFWWMVPGGYAAEGVYGQVIAVFPEDHLVVAVNSAWAHADDDASWIANVSMLEAIRAAARSTS